MFTTQTVPMYNDPEGDSVADVRIDSLPTTGILKLSGVNVVTDQIISVVDINNNLLTYKSPDEDTVSISSFTFSLRDTGSGQFST